MTSNKTNELDTFDEQRFLIDLLPFFADLKGSSIYEYYDNLGSIPDHEESTTFLSNLDNTEFDGTTIKRSNLLSRLPKQLISSLHPKVELYKVFYSGADDYIGTEVKFPLNNVQTPDSTILKSRYEGKPPGQLAVGLKKFDFDYLGTNPAEVETFIDCNLTLYFSSVDALFHIYGEGDKQISFLDFMKRPKKNVGSGDPVPPHIARQFNPKYFRIRVDISYEEPVPGFIESAVKELKIAGISGIEADAVKQEIENNRVSFFLTLVRHNVRPLLDVPSGPFEMDITFNASVETAFSSPDANLLIAGATAQQQKDLDEANVTKSMETIRGLLETGFRTAWSTTGTGRGSHGHGTVSPATSAGPGSTSTWSTSQARGVDRTEDIIDTLANYEFEDFFAARVVVSDPVRQQQRGAHYGEVGGVVEYRVAAKVINAGLWESVLGVEATQYASFTQEETTTAPFATATLQDALPYTSNNSPNYQRVTHFRPVPVGAGGPAPIFGGLGKFTTDFNALDPEVSSVNLAHQAENLAGSGDENLPKHRDVDPSRHTRYKEVTDEEREAIKKQREFDEKTSDGVFADNPFYQQGRLDERELLYDYFRARARQELYKKQHGITSRQLRISSYNRYIAQLMRPINVAIEAQKNSSSSGTPQKLTATPSMGENIKNYTKVVRTPVRRSLIKSYNRNRLRAEFTEKEQRLLTGTDQQKAQAKATQASRQDVFRNFLKGLIYGNTGGFVGNQFGQSTTDDVIADLQKQQKEWYDEIQRDIAPNSTNKRKLPEFAIAKPKLNVQDPDGEVDLRWVYFGDMIDTAIQILIAENKKLKTGLRLNLFKGSDKGMKDSLYVALGNFEYTDLQGNTMLYPVAHFPVPLRNVVAWWTTKVVEQQLEVYPLRSFIKDALLDLVVKPLNTLDRSWAPEESYKPHVEVMSISRKNKTGLQGYSLKDLVEAENKQHVKDHNRAKEAWDRLPPEKKKNTPMPLLVETTRDDERIDSLQIDVASNANNKKQELFFIGFQKTTPKHLFHNNREEDRKKGILYLEMKREGTPLYSIKFNRSDEPFQLEARADRTAGPDGLQLSEVYNVDFTTVGNMGLKPGRLIYISDPHFGDINNIVKKFQNKSANLSELYDVENAARLLGIGGYFLITKARHTIKQVGDRFDWRSSATGFWVSFGKEIGPKK